jgi:hypothetical protein
MLGSMKYIAVSLWILGVLAFLVTESPFCLAFIAISYFI